MYGHIDKVYMETTISKDTIPKSLAEVLTLKSSNMTWGEWEAKLLLQYT